MRLKTLLRRLGQPSSLGGLAAIAVAVPEIIGAGQAVGGAVAEGITSTGTAIAAGAPWYVAVALGLAAVARDDRSDTPR